MVRHGCARPEDDGSVRLWEPVHGEVLAQARASYEKQDPGCERTLPPAFRERSGGSDRANGAPHSADVELDDVDALYTEKDLWSVVCAGVLMHGTRLGVTTQALARRSSVHELSGTQGARGD